VLKSKHTKKSSKNKTQIGFDIQSNHKKSIFSFRDEGIVSVSHIQTAHKSQNRSPKKAVTESQISVSKALSTAISGEGVP